MPRYLLSPRAQADLSDIWDYGQDQWGPERADQYVREIQKVIERAAANPKRGRSCDDIRAGYFKVAAGSHLVFYRLTGDTLDVVRILHQRMDVGRHL